jgi:hypothetical protein
VLASAFLFIGIPAWLTRRRNRGTVISARPRAGMQGYFLLLGLGYIAVEVALVPRFVLFLGHPAHALSVVLFAMLTATGLGSALSQRAIGRSPKRLATAAVSVALLIAALAFGVAHVFDAALRFPFAARAAITVMLVGVPATAMGMLFPAGLARAPDGESGQSWVAHAWVLNGYASVVGSVGAMVAAIATGFTWVLLAGAACYLLAAALALTSAREQTL